MKKGDDKRCEHSTSFHQILILLFGYMFLGGGSAQLDDRVKDVLPRGERRDRARAIAKQADRMPEALASELIALHDEFYDVLAEPTVSTSELRVPLDALVEKMHASNLELLDLRFQLVEELTAKEWGKVWNPKKAPSQWRL